MDQKTIISLHQLNRRFYETVAEPFDASRQEGWLGWSKVMEQLQKHFSSDTSYRMLDLGCGNGRWGKYFLEQIAHPKTTYIGIDENTTLLQAAGRTLLPQVQVLELHRQDITSYLDNTATNRVPNFDLIVLFGVWHHLPSLAERTKLLKRLAALLKPSGILAISCWRFRRSLILAARLVDPASIGLQSDQLESGDCFLDWRSGASAVRYCHDTDETELLPQATQANLEVVQSFSADGKLHNLNDYYLLSPNPTLAV